MAKRKLPPLRERRGLDPQWHRLQCDWTIIAVVGQCAPIADAYRRAAGDIQGKAVDCLHEKVEVPGDDWERAIFVIQLRASGWSHIQPMANRVGWTTAEDMAEKLHRKLLVYSYGDTAGVFGYTYYDKGRVLEEFSTGDTPEFCAGNRAERIADGWQLSNDNMRHLRTRRLGEVNMNGSKCLDLPNQIARDLDLYIPPLAWTIHPRTGLVGLLRPWKRSDIAEARMLLAKW